MAIEGPRACRTEERESAVALANQVFRADGPSSMQGEFPVLLGEDNLDDMRVFSDGGRVVSIIAMLRRDVALGTSRHSACAIGAVCTEPDYRGQGLATRLLNDCRAKAIADDYCPYVSSGGRGLYRRPGFVDVGGYFTATVPRDKLPKDAGYTLRLWCDDDLPAMTAIHAAEPVRFVRDEADLRAFLGTGVLYCVPSETRLVCPRGSDDPVAYVVYHIGGARWEEKDENAVTIGEMAGPRWAVVQALGALMEARGIDTLDVQCLAGDAEMVEMAGTFGWPVRLHGFRGTVGIIEPERFWAGCAGHFAERLGAEAAEELRLSVDGETVRVSLGTESVELAGMTGITELVFLPAHRRGELALGLAGGSELGAALAQVFPLPLVDYGLNYQ